MDNHSETQDRIHYGGALRWLTDSPTTLPLTTGSMGRWIAMFCLAGSAIGLVITLSLPDPLQYKLNLGINGVFLVVSSLLYLRAESITRRGANIIVAIGTVVITLQIATGSGMDPAIMAVVFYAWVALYVFAFLSTLEAATQIGFVILCYSLALIFGQRPSAPLSDWILTTSTVLVASISTGYLNYQIRLIALTDPLTGIANRKGWELAYQREIARAQRLGSAILIAIVDLNNFKQINDLYGHAVGDRILVETARDLKEAIRPFDLVARWGGDEFVIFALLENPDSGHLILDRIVKHVGRNTELSCGAYATYLTANHDDLLARADEVLYKAKENSNGGYLLEFAATVES